MLIIRSSNCINTASGIVISVSDRPMCRLRRNLNLHTGRSLTENALPGTVLIEFDLLMMSIVARNMYRIVIINVLYKVFVHQVGHLLRVVPRCTGRKT